jgi:hypothetical protein
LIDTFIERPTWVTMVMFSFRSDCPEACKGRDGWRGCSTRQEDEQNDVPEREPGAPRYCTLSRCTNTIAIDLQACRDQGFDSFRRPNTPLSAYPLADFYDLTSTLIEIASFQLSSLKNREPKR